MNKPQYKRILLKLSGEALLGKKEFGIDYHVLDQICEEIRSVHDLGVEIIIVMEERHFQCVRIGLEGSRYKGTDDKSAGQKGSVGRRRKMIAVAHEWSDIAPVQPAIWIYSNKTSAPTTACRNLLQHLN